MLRTSREIYGDIRSFASTSGKGRIAVVGSGPAGMVFSLRITYQEVESGVFLDGEGE